MAFTTYLSAMQEDKNAIFQMRFPQKLWILQNYLQCEESIFKTANISSFVRQLNLYGFRKFGRPELLNKITRKALTVRKTMKPMSVMYNHEESMYLTPLEKARRAFRTALKKTAQDLYAQNTPRDFSNFKNDGASEMFYEDEIEFDWCVGNLDTPNEASNQHQAPAPTLPSPPPENLKKKKVSTTPNPVPVTTEEDKLDSSNSQDTLMNISDDACQTSNESFSNQFLSMPDLDAEPSSQSQTGVELLAEFDINNDCDQGIIKKIDNDDSMLNCVLPSINNVDSLAEKNDQGIDHYNGEWDQMFNDMMNKENQQDQENGVEAKDFFSHISKTLDLLNS